ncbi:MAG TPA: biopolymer transporter ExbD [Candidatus Acidoferrum sp.]|jgi:biopolymer transport protein ExbD|nr:biopolymer transporter ExbD [Candidatus Acidoferrum sp.]
MAFSTNGGGYGSRRRGTPPLSEMNVTPFVDVVLVLLIIFMLTAHVMESGIEVDVPAVRPTKARAQDLPVITVSKTGEFTIAGSPVNINQVKETVLQKYPKAKAVYLRADKDTIWDVVAQMTAELGAAGFQVNMVTQPLDNTPTGKK